MSPHVTPVPGGNWTQTATSTNFGAAQLRSQEDNHTIPLNILF